MKKGSTAASINGMKSKHMSRKSLHSMKAGSPPIKTPTKKLESSKISSIVPKVEIKAAALTIVKNPNAAKMVKPSLKRSPQPRDGKSRLS